MKTHIDPKDISVQKLFGMMLGAIAPRPIAFASTVDEQGRPNLAPFSFFNGFGANPPILVFSPSRRGRDNTTKHTYDNLKKVPEVVINVVTYDMVQQVSLASSDFPEGINEFEKVGFTMEASDKIKPFRVKESPVQFECKVNQIIETGDQGAAGNLVISEIVKVHINNDVLDANGNVDPLKLDLVGRMGGNYYCRASGSALFEVEKPLTSVGIGVDVLPEHARFSKTLTGNELGQLGNLKSIPTKEEIEDTRRIFVNMKHFEKSREDQIRDLHVHAQLLISDGEVYEALKVLCLDE